MSPFKALETTIKKQDDEIERLKNTQKVRTPIKAKGCPRGFLNFNINTLMNTDGLFAQQRSLICPSRRRAFYEQALRTRSCVLRIFSYS